MWDFTTNKVNSRSLRVLMTDDQAYNIWQSACISLLPKRKKHQSIHKWVVFLLIVYDSTVRSGDLFWLRLNLKHMERHNFLAGIKIMPDLFLWFFCSQRAWQVSGDCLSLWHRMPAGVHGSRGEVTVWHLFVFTWNEAILWHSAVHFSENRNSSAVPKDCQL